MIVVGQRLRIPGGASAVDALAQAHVGDRYTVDYAAGWHTNSGAVAGACGCLDRHSSTVEAGTELVTDIVLNIDPVAFGAHTAGRLAPRLIPQRTLRRH